MTESLDVVRHIWEGKLEGGAGGCAPASKPPSRPRTSSSALVCTPFYRILVRQDPGEQRGRGGPDRRLCRLRRRRAAEPGPFFCGPRLSPADVAVAPWALRIPLLEHYRTWFELPTAEADPRMAAFRAWLAAVRAQPAVAATIADEAELRKAYLRYADGTAQSKVGDAIRRAVRGEGAVKPRCLWTNRFLSRRRFRPFSVMKRVPFFHSSFSTWFIGCRGSYLL